MCLQRRRWTGKATINSGSLAAALFISACACVSHLHADRLGDGDPFWEKVYSRGTGAVGSIVELKDGTMLASVSGSGILVSEDRGQTWQSVEGFMPNSNAVALRAHPVLPEIIVAALFPCPSPPAPDNKCEWSSYAHVSVDGGKTWDRVDDTPPAPSACYDVGTFNGRVYVGCIEGLFAHPDSGLTFESANGDLDRSDDGTGSPILEIEGHEKEGLLYVVQQYMHGAFVVKTTDGRHWDFVGPDWADVGIETMEVTESSGWIYLGLRASPYATGVESVVYRSTTQGETWESIGGTISASVVHAFATAPEFPNRVYAATDSGLYVWPTGGDDWRQMMGGA